MKQAWSDCLAYLEAHCNPLDGPFPAASARYAQVLWMLADCIEARVPYWYVAVWAQKP